ncbi:MAG: hypothetical protein KDC71_13575 [Acidobacteria bacterium]|nr:hypothetical protein [Acidobacteriota bacterium]
MKRVITSIRPIIAVPLDMESNNLLQGGWIDESVKFRWVKVSDQVSKYLNENLFYYKLNSLCDSFIGDFEEDDLKGEKLLICQKYLHEFQEYTSNTEVKVFLSTLISFVQSAIERNVSVFFIL